MKSACTILLAMMFLASPAWIIAQDEDVRHYGLTTSSTDSVGIAENYRKLADAYSDAEDYPNAEKYYSLAKETLESHNLKGEKTYRLTLHGMALMYATLHNYEKAILLSNDARYLYMTLR